VPKDARFPERRPDGPGPCLLWLPLTVPGRGRATRRGNRPLFRHTRREAAHGASNRIPSGSARDTDCYFKSLTVRGRQPAARTSASRATAAPGSAPGNRHPTGIQRSGTRSGTQEWTGPEFLNAARRSAVHASAPEGADRSVLPSAAKRAIASHPLRPDRPDLNERGPESIHGSSSCAPHSPPPWSRRRRRAGPTRHTAPGPGFRAAHAGSYTFRAPAPPRGAGAAFRPDPKKSTTRQERGRFHVKH